MAATFYPLFILFLIHKIQAQSNTVGYKCQAQSTMYPCQTYVIYRATHPLFDNLDSIADLFGVSPFDVAKSSNIWPLDSTLLPWQPIFVPVKCSCNSVNSSFAISYAPLSYTMRSGDTLSSVSTQTFQNLVTFQSVHLADPDSDRVPFYLVDEVTIPIFCRCPSSLQAQKYLITYVFQPDDTLSAVASMFGSSEKLILEINGGGVSPLAAIFVPVSHIPKFAYGLLEKKDVVLGLEIGLGICGVLLVLVCGVWLYREYQFKKMGGLCLCRDERRFLKAEDEVGLMADVAGCLDKYKMFKIEELRKATNGFDAGSIIKGSVYRGCMDHKLYAIKKIKWDAYEELRILQKVNHGNLVRLEGFCIDPQDSNCYVVYEYVENGSLHSWLHVEKNKRLSWNTRLRIAIDVAYGLQYIHEHTRPKVVHKDIKSSNILLDSNMRAKIASFGLAKSGHNAVTMNIVGTRGYIAPEYLGEGLVSTKMDVFSFGVVLLELVSGGEVVDEEGKPLWAKVNGILDEGKLRSEWMDGCLNENSCTIESVMRVMVVAIACLHEDPRRRPNMDEIVYALSRNDDLVPFDVSQELHCPR